MPGRHQLFMHGCDISRAADGAFRVNADWTQAPSGAGYALADRRVVAHAIPDLYERIGPRPASPWAQALRLALIDAAPESAEEPVVVVLSPGIHSETAFDQAYLASVLGFPLVESADLVVRDGKLWMRSLGTLKRVDVVLRRVDADYADPLDLRADSRLGVVGLVEVLRRGAVTVVNTLGSGILESPGLLRFLPELAERLLGETPLLETAPMYWGGIDAERSHLLEQPGVAVDQAGRPAARPIVGPALSSAQREDAGRAHRGHAVAVGRPGTAAVLLGAHRLLPGGLSSASVGMRLFTVCPARRLRADDRRPRLPAGARQRRLRAENRCGQGYLGADADAGHAPSGSRRRRRSSCPAMTPSPTRAVSSPRVLSDLFWMGRYAERAENMARLLTVTRERYHEYRYRQDMRGQRVRAGAAGRAGPDHRNRHRRRRRLRRDDRDRADDAVVADRRPAPARLAGAVGRAARAWPRARCATRCPTTPGWCWPRSSARCCTAAGLAAGIADRGRRLPASTAQPQTLAGMLALSGVAAESMVHDVGWTMMDIGKRIERGLWLTALLRATLTTVRSPGAEQTITESTLVACESSVIYRRRNLGKVSVAAVADWCCSTPRTRGRWCTSSSGCGPTSRRCPASSGSSRPERLVDEIVTRLRRLDPGRPRGRRRADGQRGELAELLDGMHADLRELSGVITATHLSLPGGMQPLWGPDERRVMP